MITADFRRLLLARLQRAGFSFHTNGPDVWWWVWCGEVGDDVETKDEALFSALDALVTYANAMKEEGEA